MTLAVLVKAIFSAQCTDSNANVSGNMFTGPPRKFLTVFVAILKLDNLMLKIYYQRVYSFKLMMEKGMKVIDNTVGEQTTPFYSYF
jgi:hypothetical protein